MGFLRGGRERAERRRSAAHDKRTNHSAWIHREPAASRCSGRTIHSERPSTAGSCNATGPLTPYANTDRPPLDEAASDDEGDERFASGGPANTAPYRRLDSTSTSLRPESWFAISLPATPTNPASISISSSAESRMPDRRGEEMGFLRRGRERAERPSSPAAMERSGIAVRCSALLGVLELPAINSYL